MRQVYMSLVAAAGIMTTGCGDAGAPKPATGEPGMLALEDFGQFLKALPADGKKPPTKMSEFEPLEPMAPVAGPALTTKQITYYWGTGLDDKGDKVVAYETKAETEGGYVLLQNGTVKKMTADEFKAAPKAGKK